MTDKQLRTHQEKMLKFALERNIALDDTIRRIESYIQEAGYEQRGTPKVPKGTRVSRTSITKCARLLIEALDVIRKLTGK